jgi:hypothetical protein
MYRTGTKTRTETKIFEKKKEPRPEVNQRLTSSYPLVLIQVIQNKSKTESDY